MIVINYKNYVHGKKALDLSRKIQKYLPKAIVCPSAVDLAVLAEKTKLKVFAQHIDSKIEREERATGFITSESVRGVGVKGTLLNHSEHQLGYSVIKDAIREARSEGLKVILCVKSLNEVRHLSSLGPWAMAFEDEKLVGSKKSVVEYRSEKVRKFAELLRDTGIIPLCGAGIHSAVDVRASEELGCKGVLISSAVAHSKNPEGLLKAFSKI